MEYKQLTIDTEKGDIYQNYLMQVLALSKDWANEKTCPSYQASQLEDFYGSELFLVLQQDRVVAYATGNIKVLNEKTSYNVEGEQAFELEELYVKPTFRHQDIGRNLFRFIEKQMIGKVDLIGLTATSYRYPDLLRFYIDELGMTFNHALLIKRMD